MWKYIRLMRIQDQYIQSSAVFAAGVFIHDRSLSMLFWAIAVTCLSIAGFILNEIIDKDTDVHSWNPVHKEGYTNLNMTTVRVMFLLVSIIGLGLSWMSGFLGWGMIFWILALLYSLEPIRLKRVFILDELVQVVVWVVIPFIAPLLGTIDTTIALTVTFISSMLIWSAFFPYELADMEADQKAGMKNTHVILGLRKSLLLGLFVGISGLLGFFHFRIYSIFPLVWFCEIASFIVMVYSIKWLLMDSDKKILQSIQKFMLIFKPATGFVFPFTLIWWMFS